MQKQRGFGTIEIVIIIALLAVIGFLGWRLYTANTSNKLGQGSSVSDTAQTDMDKTETKITKTVELSAWGLAAENKSGYTFVLAQSANGSSYRFTTEELAQKGDFCGVGKVGETEAAGAGWIYRFKAEDTIDFGASPVKGKEYIAELDKDPTLSQRYKKIGDYYVAYVSPQALCGDSAEELQPKVNTAVKELVQSIYKK